MAESSTATSAAEAFGWRYALLRREKLSMEFGLWSCFEEFIWGLGLRGILRGTCELDFSSRHEFLRALEAHHFPGQNPDERVVRGQRGSENRPNRNAISNALGGATGQNRFCNMLTARALQRERGNARSPHMQTPAGHLVGKSPS